MTVRRRVVRGAAAGGAALVAGVGVGVALAGSGGLDPSFGTNGATVLTNPTETFPAEAASAAGGKTVLISTAGGQVTVTRLQQDGSPDPTFDTDGKATLTTPASPVAARVVVLSDGKILVVGSSSSGANLSDVIVWRLKAEGGSGAANGALDPTFDGDGIAVIDSGNYDRGLALAVRSDGKLVVTGTTLILPGPSPTKVGVWRLLANGGPGAVNGALDPGFDTDGAAGINDTANDQPEAVALRPDNKIVIAGETDLTATSRDGAIWRLNADGGPGAENGALDTSFDTDGKAQIDNAGNEGARSLALQPDGKIVIAGFTSNGAGGGNAMVWRLQANGGAGAVNGALDPSFDADGVGVVDSGGFDSAGGVALQPDGKILVAGNTQLPANPSAATVWRMMPDGGPGAVNGALDPAFGTGGTATFNAGTGAAATAVMLHPDRRIVAVGATFGETLFAFRVLGDPFALSIARAGTGSGAVRSSPAGIDCTQACSAGFDLGSRVTLSATPASGSTFAGWSGAGCGGTGACAVTMNVDQAVTATFNAVAKPKHFVLRASKLSMKRFKHRAHIVSAIISGLPRRTRLSGALVTGRITLAKAKVTVGASGRGKLVFRFSTKSRKRVRSRKLKAVTLKVTATPPGDTASRASKRIKLKS